MVREVDARMLWKVLELLSLNGERFEIQQLLFADTAIVDDSEESYVDWRASLVEYAKEES